MHSSLQPGVERLQTHGTRLRHPGIYVNQVLRRDCPRRLSYRSPEKGSLPWKAPAAASPTTSSHPQSPQTLMAFPGSFLVSVHRSQRLPKLLSAQPHMIWAFHLTGVAGLIPVGYSRCGITSRVPDLAATPTAGTTHTPLNRWFSPTGPAHVVLSVLRYPPE
jgi:hypothetical protein